MSPTPTPPVYCQSPRRLVWGSTLRPSPNLEGLGCREDYFEAHLCGSYVHCDLPVRLHACSPPRLAATQLARSAVLNRLIAPTGLSPALTPASRAHRNSEADPSYTAYTFLRKCGTSFCSLFRAHTESSASELANLFPRLVHLLLQFKLLSGVGGDGMFLLQEGQFLAPDNQRSTWCG